MSEVFALDKHNNYVPTMTREEIIAAIQTAAKGGTLEGFNNCAFVSQIKELNKNAAFSVWVGTQAEYNALAEKAKNVLYIISDEQMASELKIVLDSVKREVASHTQTITQQAERLAGMAASVDANNNAVAAAVVRMAEIEQIFAEKSAALDSVQSELEPLVIFENAAGSTTCLTTEAINKFREIAVVFAVIDNGDKDKPITRVYQRRLFTADIYNNEIWLRGESFFSYVDGREKLVDTAARFVIEHSTNSSSLNLSKKATQAHTLDDDFSSRFYVGIVKIYGIGRVEV